MSANRNSTGERSHRALIPHANFRKRARPHTTLPPLPSSSSFSLSFVSSSSSSGDSPLYCFSNKSLSGSYALRLSLPPHSHIDKSAAEQISNLLLDRLLSSLLPPPSRQKPESSKRASSVSYQSSSGFTDRSLLPPFLTSFPSTDLPLPRVSPRDFSFLLPLLPSTA